MKQRWFPLVALLTTLGLCGIIALQAYWIRQSWKLKEEEFDQAVMNSLDRVAEQVSERNVIRILNSIPEEYPHHPLTINRHEEHTFTRTLNVPEDENGKMVTEIRIEALDSLEERTVEISQHVEQLEADMQRIRHMNAQLEEKLTVGLENIPLPEEQTLQRITLLSQAVMDSINSAGIMKPLDMVENIVSDVIIRLDRDPASSLSFINDRQMQEILQHELQNKKIDQAFRFKVLNEGTGKILLSSDSLHAAEWLTTPYEINLTGTAGHFDRLMLYFPHKRDYIMQSMSGIIIISVLLSLLALTGMIVILRWFTRQQQLAAMKTQFINNMTHEFKTPLATTLVAANTLNNPKVYSQPEQVKYYTDLIKEENRVMNRQIETVLQAALLDRNKLVLKNEPVEMGALVNGTLEALRLQLEQSGAEIHTEIPNTPFYISGDADHLQQVISNLVINSIKYTNGKPVIHIRITEQKNKLWLEVKDNGIGIHKKDQKHIFEPFYRVHTGNLHAVKGFGLGLNYVKKIMAAHKGRVMVNSEPGKGATFTLIFNRHEQ